jgi:hypothetical protein
MTRGRFELCGIIAGTRALQNKDKLYMGLGFSNVF